MQHRRCVSSANTAGVLPRLDFSQDLPEKCQQIWSPCERCMFVLGHLSASAPSGEEWKGSHVLDVQGG